MKTLSFVVHSWYNPEVGATCVQVMSTGNVQTIQFADTSFLLRVMVDEEDHIHRCLVRHLASGREVYVQGGTRLGEFLKTCVLDTAS